MPASQRATRLRPFHLPSRASRRRSPDSTRPYGLLDPENEPRRPVAELVTALAGIALCVTKRVMRRAPVAPEVAVEVFHKARSACIVDLPERTQDVARAGPAERRAKRRVISPRTTHTARTVARGEGKQLTSPEVELEELFTRQDPRASPEAIGLRVRAGEGDATERERRVATSPRSARSSKRRSGPASVMPSGRKNPWVARWMKRLPVTAA